MKGRRGFGWARQGFGLGACLWVLASLAACGGEPETKIEVRVECAEVCEIGEATCEDGVVVRCLEDEDGCPAPEIEVCGQDEVCDEGACVARQCPEGACDLGARSCRDDATQVLCLEGRDGCGVEVEVACGQGAVCADGECVGGCVDGDGDGFGQGCEAGPDCDDGDAAINPQAQELCDGADNNCDGVTDEGFDTLGDTCTAGVGACEAQGVEVCALDGAGTVCDAVEGQPLALDLCGNLIDDDCDGEVDEGFDTLGEACTAGVGACEAQGVEVCAEDGLTTLCEATLGEPGEESCNGLDDDCDGEVDEDFGTLGEACTVGQGVCEAGGALICAEDGAGVVCDAQPGPGAEGELCGNGLDDDCDGLTDEDFPEVGTLCAVGVGVCRKVGIQVCGPGGLGSVCSAVPDPEGVELCGNGLDDDCDGDVDEGFEDIGATCEVGQGACGGLGFLTCASDRLSLVCGAQEGEVGEEVCDGIDNDCDGEVDEDFEDLGTRCSVGQGICARDGVRVCAPGGEGTVCNVQPGDPAPEELCGNGLDDNCDGSTDEGFDTVGDSCGDGIGACFTQGEIVCSPDRLSVVCDAQPGEPAQEACDGLDNDCDGVVDGPVACGQCLEDPFEPNDSPGQASALALGESIDAQICFFNRDNYSLGRLEGGSIQINAVFTHAQADIDVGLFRDGRFVPAQGGSSGTDNEVVRADNLQPGNYTIQVLASGGRGSAPYRLAAFAAAANFCQRDLFEPDDDELSARPLAPGVEVTRRACGPDQDPGGDWFDLGQLGVETRIDAQAIFSHAFGDIDMELVRIDGVQAEVVASAESVTNNESISLVTEAAGRYFLRVFNLTDGVGSEYRLSYTLASVCEDDALEDNDTPETALPVNLGLVALGRSCAGDDDWYLLNRTYQAGELIRVNAVFDQADGDLDMELYLGGTRLVASSRSTTDNEQLRHLVTTPGNYFVRIFAVSGQPRYHMSHIAPRPDDCQIDEYEIDSFLDTATVGRPGRTYSMVACPPINQGIDFDLMSLGELEAGTTIQGQWIFEHARGNIDVGLFADLVVDGVQVREFVTFATSTDDDEVLEFTVDIPGRYLLATFMQADNNGETDGNAYRVRYTLEAP